MNSVASPSPYCGTAPLPGELLARWNSDPVVITLLVFAMFTVVILNWLKPNVFKRKLAIAAVLALAFLLFISPFCALSSALFSVRVLHHIILTGIAAPLLVFSFATPNPPGIQLGPAAAAAHAVIFWFWHMPPVYEAALASSFVYWVMQTSLFGSAALLWFGVRTASKPIAILILLATMVQMGLLGALLTFAPSPLYASHLLTTDAWGLSALTDQQLAGMVMWNGGSAVYLVAALACLYRLVVRQTVSRQC